MKLERMLVAFAAALIILPALSAQDLLVRGGKVITVSGAEHEAGAILIRGGKIVEVAETIEAPEGVPVLEALGRVVMPGFVVAQTSNGLDRPNEVVDVVPYVSVKDALDPSRTFFEDSLRDGHLTLCVMPGERTVVGGTGLVVHPRGLTVEQMTVLPDAGMKLSLIPRAGNRAVQLSRLRAAIADALRHKKERELARDEELKASGSATLDLERLGADDRRTPLLRMLAGEIPAYIACGTAADVMHAIKLAKEHSLDARLVVGPGTWKAAEMMAASKFPVILGPDIEVRDTDPETGKRMTRNVAKILHDAGVKFAITNRPGSLGNRYQWYQAARLVRAGLSRQDALAAVTLNGARAIGLGDRKGSLEKGKDGDLLVLTADPLSGRAWVDQAVVGGRIVYERSEDPRLADLIGTGKR